MPFPITPITDIGVREIRPPPSQYSLPDTFFSSDNFNFVSAMDKSAAISDGDAALTFELWKSAKAVDAEAKTYEIPTGFTNDKLLQLKASGIVSGDQKIVQFTQKGANIIKNYVLSENNSIGAGAVKKPYSVILAELKKPVRKGNLALAGLYHEAMKNVDLGESLTKYSVWVQSHRYRYVGGGSNKEYTVRIYKSDLKPDTYNVICFNGSFGNTQTPQPKVTRQSLAVAKSNATLAENEKIAKGYKLIDGENPYIPGVQGVVLSPDSLYPKSKPKVQAPTKPAQAALYSIEQQIEAKASIMEKYGTGEDFTKDLNIALPSPNRIFKEFISKKSARIATLLKAKLIEGSMAFQNETAFRTAFLIAPKEIINMGQTDLTFAALLNQKAVELVAKTYPSIFRAIPAEYISTARTHIIAWLKGIQSKSKNPIDAYQQAGEKILSSGAIVPPSDTVDEKINAVLGSMYEEAVKQSLDTPHDAPSHTMFSDPSIDLSGDDE